MEIQTGESLEGRFPAWWEGVGEWMGAVGGVRGHGGVGRVGGV